MGADMKNVDGTPRAASLTPLQNHLMVCCLLHKASHLKSQYAQAGRSTHDYYFSSSRESIGEIKLELILLTTPKPPRSLILCNTSVLWDTNHQQHAARLQIICL